MKVTIELDSQQLGILMSQLEGMFRESHTGVRTLEMVREEVELAAKYWHPKRENDGFEFEIVKMAPVYRRLFDLWKEQGDQSQESADIIATDSLGEFVSALRSARAALEMGGPRD